jgi:acylphosphatase
MTICKHCIISGSVQGVFFRASTARRAKELKLSGYARNLPDGHVEVLVCGDAAAVDALCEWLWEGPSAAQVTDVTIREVERVDIPEEFTVG